MNQTKFEGSEFRKSTLSDRWANGCVSVAIRSDVVAVRHTRDPAKTTLEYTPDEWRAFIQGVKEGQFDLKS